jgi:hypothetical protein
MEVHTEGGRKSVKRMPFVETAKAGTMLEQAGLIRETDLSTALICPEHAEECRGYLKDKRSAIQAA